MERPEFLMAVTVAEHREVYKANQKILDDIAALVMTNTLVDIDESVLNQLCTKLILEREYIRKREAENWR